MTETHQSGMASPLSVTRLAKKEDVFLQIYLHLIKIRNRLMIFSGTSNATATTSLSMQDWRLRQQKKRERTSIHSLFHIR